MKLRNNQGFTLIEIAIVLTIVGLIIGGIWVAASTVFNNNKAQSFTKDLIQVVQNTKTLFAGQGASASGVGFTVQNAYTAGVFPNDMISGASTPAAPVVITPYSTTPTVTDVAVAAAASTVKYTINDLTQQACTQALTTLGSSQNVTNLGITALAGGPAAGNAIAALPVTGATAATACVGQAGTANTGYGIAVTMNLI